MLSYPQLLMNNIIYHLVSFFINLIYFFRFIVILYQKFILEIFLNKSLMMNSQLPLVLYICNFNLNLLISIILLVLLIYSFYRKKITYLMLA